MLISRKVKKFNDDLKFVTYYLETFRGNNSGILPEFLEKYPQREFHNTNQIQDFIENEADNEFSKVIEILSLFQYLFVYFVEDKKIRSKNFWLNNNYIKNIPYISKSKICLNFFKCIQLNIRELFEAYSFIEKSCFKLIYEFVNKGFYHGKIEDNKIKNIKNLFKRIKSFSKREFVEACRKLIARYLVGIRNDMDINENNELHVHLTRRDLWPVAKWKNEDAIIDDLKLIGNEGILVAQCYDLYKNIGGDVFN